MWDFVFKNSDTSSVNSVALLVKLHDSWIVLKGISLVRKCASFHGDFMYELRNILFITIINITSCISHIPQSTYFVILYFWLYLFSCIVKWSTSKKNTLHLHWLLWSVCQGSWKKHPSIIATNLSIRSARAVHISRYQVNGLNCWQNLGVIGFVFCSVLFTLALSP